jgi:hypothetical protein
VPVLFEAPGRLFADWRFRRGRERRRAVSQGVVPSPMRSARGVFSAGHDRGAAARAPGLASSPYDEEGVATAERAVVRDGVLAGYFLGCYSARKLGMRSTGSAGGNHNLVVRSEATNLRGMLQRLHRGLFVTELLGHGVNLVTGDFSQGAPAIGSKAARLRSRSRKSRWPETCATCSGASRASAATPWCAARGEPARSSSKA